MDRDARIDALLDKQDILECLARFAVITGGARGLGFAYAQLLGSLGAKIVGNDNGSAMSGTGSDLGPAEAAAQALRAAGCEAVACSEGEEMKTE
nr:hypothetical protein TQ38_08820 [Novosphingobium sp. P6W]